MRVFFIMPLPHRVYPLQVAAITAYLKRLGHEIEYMDLELGNSDVVGPQFQRQFEDKLEEFKPGLVAFSTYDMYHDWTTQIARIVKNKTDVPILAGGYLATLFPKEFFDIDEIDFIGIGEGEMIMEQLLRRLEDKNPCDDVPGIYYRENGKFVENPVKLLIEDINSLPFADRELFDYQEHIGIPDQNHPALFSLIASRGCAYKCTYCANEFMREKYENYKEFVRFREPENICEEIEENALRYNFNVVSFEDAMFTGNKKWLARFSEIYSKRIGLPFYCNIRPESIRPDVAKLLADAGCVSASMGLESGDPELRRAVLGRYMSNDLLLRCNANLQKVGINVRTFNIVGLPNESWASLYRTLKINYQLAPFAVQTSIYYPLKGTILGDQCFEDDIVDMEKFNKIRDYAFESPLRKQKLPNWAFIFAKWLNSSIGLWRGGNLNLIKIAFNMLFDKIKLDFRQFKGVSLQAIRSNNTFVHTNDLDR